MTTRRGSSTSPPLSRDHIVAYALLPALARRWQADDLHLTTSHTTSATSTPPDVLYEAWSTDSIPPTGSWPSPSPASPAPSLWAPAHGWPAHVWPTPPSLRDGEWATVWSPRDDYRRIWSPDSLEPTQTSRPPTTGSNEEVMIAPRPIAPLAVMPDWSESWWLERPGRWEGPSVTSRTSPSLASQEVEAVEDEEEEDISPADSRRALREGSVALPSDLLAGPGQLADRSDLRLDFGPIGGGAEL